MHILRFPVALASILFPSVALACLWDYDTLLQERGRFPDTLELITGKFLRHSREFYYWRISDRLQKLKDEPENLAYHDDLAVAYDKIGDQHKAIEIMLSADKKKPGRYETEANLGTFYIHAGQWEEGLKHIDNALRINPNAHFGREKYQRFLVEFMLICRDGANLSLPIARTNKAMELYLREGFSSFLAKKQGFLTPEERKEAIKGILGIMRFGNFESPVVLEALASLLVFNNPSEDAKQLAARAYLKASYVTANETKKGYREMAKDVLYLQVGTNLETQESSFQQELTEAKAWSEQVQRDELSWIQSGKNPEVEFARKYYQEPQVSTTWTDYIAEIHPIVFAVLAGFAFLGVLWGIKRYYSRKASRPTTA